MNHKQIRDAILWWKLGSDSVFVRNIFPPRSPWESDLIAVTAAGFWQEYEVKLSRSDFQADFRKRVIGLSKHDHYARGNSGGGKIPIPKQFWFCAPVGVIDPDWLPGHCGLAEVGETQVVQVVKHPRSNPNATRFSFGDLHAIARKASFRESLR